MKWIFIVLFFSLNVSAQDFIVWNGNHRAIAVIILTKSGRLAPTTVVGKIEGLPLTAQKLTELYDSGFLRTANVNRFGKAEFDSGQVSSIVTKFDMKQLFGAGQTIGVQIIESATKDTWAAFKEQKAAHGHGESTEVFVASYLEQLAIQQDCMGMLSNIGHMMKKIFRHF
jgi:hypothetical protein